MTNIRLLVVDDEPDTCANLADIFGELGYKVDVALNGFTALELMERNSYDIALLDLKMPGMDGLELYRRMHKLSAGTVAIIVTAYATGETARTVLEAGAWHVLSKPVNLHELLGLVAEAAEQPLLLVVDDDRDLCNSLWDVFRSRGYRVSFAHDAGDARELVGRQKFQIVLIDMKLTKGSGVEVVQSVRQANPKASTILITGYRGEMDRVVQQTLANGADAVCYKPFDVPKLLDTVDRFAREHSAEAN